MCVCDGRRAGEKGVGRVSRGRAGQSRAGVGGERGGTVTSHRGGWVVVVCAVVVVGRSRCKRERVCVCVGLLVGWWQRGGSQGVTRVHTHTQ